MENTALEELSSSNGETLTFPGIKALKKNSSNDEMNSTGVRIKKVRAE